ncbi:acyltransferase family protein [Paenibacillus sp. OAS669]|uniref:acyltransferase family protein n=1 Tax=Paenibacillus sp. OAS669 TaxID=2663821 RepID=UPI00178ACFDC|nr:acyltransferase [Paenibacillus sp. OAS669]MBE1445684.1 peptidoglycan/LPS O-acetylase OafA/YrhL [Paenibacillus sp. OAS669]
MSKLNHLEGIRGIAALIVIFAHFLWGFYPVLHVTGNLPFEPGITMFNVLYSGHFAVCMFFVLSGFVLSYKFFQTGNIQFIKDSAIKRYVRLVVPVFISIFISYIIMKLGWIYNLQVSVLNKSSWMDAWWKFEPSLKTMLTDMIFLRSNYNNVLWTIKYEIYGAFMVFSFIALFHDFKYRRFLYVVLIAVLYDTYYLGFILGMMLCDLKVTTIKINLKNNFINIIIFFIGVYFVSYPAPTNINLDVTMYSWIKISWVEYPSIFWHIVGSTLMLFAVINSTWLEKFFSLNPFIYLGKVSFSIYLLHIPVIGSISSYVFLKLVNTNTYFQSFMVSFLLSLFIIFIIAHFFQKWIDEGSIKLSNYLLSKVSKSVTIPTSNKKKVIEGKTVKSI